MKITQILNAGFHQVDMNATLEHLFDLVEQNQRGWISTVNVAILMMMRDSAFLQSYVDESSLVIADGQPLIWTSSWFGQVLPERVTGVDLVMQTCARAEKEQLGVYFLGATDDVIGKLEQRLKAKFPLLSMHFANGYFSQDEFQQRAEQVAQSGAAILFVGMGVPRQEQFIKGQWQNLGVNVAVGVGGSFDVLCGLRSRAPHWIQKIGMEWFYRMVQEPRRLFGRYLSTNSRFIGLILTALVNRKSSQEKK